MYSLSICADTLFCELPFEQRVKQIADAGYPVEFWTWQGRDIDTLARDPNIKIISFLGSNEGSLVHPSGLKVFLESAMQTIPIAQQLQCQQLVLLTGPLNTKGETDHPIAIHPATRWITAYKGLCQMAEIAEKYDLIYNLETLNTKIDHIGYPLTLVEDAVHLIEQVDSPRIKILLDIYHVQIQEGNVLDLIHKYANHIGHVHVADVPGRHEPGTGEINYPQVSAALRDIGYEGTVGLECYPQRDSHEAMVQFKEIFS